MRRSRDLVHRFVPAFFYHITNFFSTFTITKPHKHAHLRDTHLIKTKQTNMFMVLDLFFIPPTPKFLGILTYKHTQTHQHCTVFCATLSIVLFLFLLTNLRTYGRPKKPNKQEPTTTFTSKQAFTRHCPSFCTTSALFKTKIWHICVHATLSILLYLLLFYYHRPFFDKNFPILGGGGACLRGGLGATKTRLFNKKSGGNP